MSGNLVLVTGPSEEPASDGLFRTHARIDHSEEQEIIALYLSAARQWVEAYTKRQLMTATWRLELEDFPGWELYLPRPPLVSVSSITYTDPSDGSTDTLSSSDYSVDTGSEPGIVTPAYGDVWPTTRSQRRSVKATYIAGYTSAALVPASLKSAILLLAGARYENREPAEEEWATIKNLCDPYRVGDDFIDYLLIDV